MSSEALSKHQRQERIVALLRANPAVRIAELARTFNVSTETVRRDLDALSRAGVVSRTYGGAARAAVAFEAAVNERLREQVQERVRIAACAARLIHSAEVVMIDGGSTTIHLARQLAATLHDITLITNSLGVATTAGRNPALRVVLCPGDYEPHEGIVTGPDTLAFIDRFNADLTLIGAGGLTAEGPSEVHPGAAWVKRHMLARARRHILLVDAKKFGRLCLERVCSLQEIDDLITDLPPEGDLAAALDGAGVTIHVAPATESAAAEEGG